MKVLFVVRSWSALRSIGRSPGWRAAADGECACCFVHEADDGGRDHLGLQQRMTTDLRAVLGAGAEGVAIFVVSGRAGDGVDDCAAAWGATEVVELE
ncbi:MAG TPA: hypothetical protein VMZ28_30905 [Kofleriaceae bacterium]|nr:hypothetical protein [Kofleriaceae bacterium]